MSRPISDAWFHRVKAATRDLVKACGGVVRTGEIANVSKTEVSRWQSATDADVISIPAALALEAECGLPLVTTAMAELHGRRLADADGTGESSAHVAAEHAEAVRAVAELMAVGAVALADGDVTPAEAAQMDRLASEAERKLSPLRKSLAGIRGRAGKIEIVAGGK